MSVKKLKKGFISFLFISMLLALAASCSTKGGSEEQGNGDSSSGEQQDISSSAQNSSDSQSSVTSSSSRANTSSSSVAAAVSSSSRATSSSSVATTNSSSSMAAAASSSSRATSSSSVATTTSSSSVAAANSSSSVAAAASSSSTGGGDSKTCSFARGQTKDIQYIPAGTSGLNTSKHKLHLTLPPTSKGNGPFPVVLFLHGGAFAGGSRDDSPGASSKAPDNGYALVSIGYRLSGDAGGTFPGSFNDILTAIRFLKTNAETYCLDPDKFAVTGFSAGAYHAGMVCVLSGYPDHGLDGWNTLYQGVNSKVQACATYAALSDMALLEEHEKTAGGSFMIGHGADSPEAKFLGINTTLKSAPETPPPNASVRWKANPINYITANTPPILMLHGSSDNVVPWVQSEYMVGKINEKASGRATFSKESGGHSGFDNQSAKVFTHLDKYLK
jgi:acetyl esterase/lipase